MVSAKLALHEDCFVLTVNHLLLPLVFKEKASMWKNVYTHHLILFETSQLSNQPICALIWQAESTNATNESILKVALDHGKAFGVIKSHDRIVVCQKVGDASVVKIIELED